MSAVSVGGRHWGRMCMHVCVSMCMCISTSTCKSCSVCLWWSAAETEHAGFYNQDSGITFSPPSSVRPVLKSSQTGREGGGEEMKRTDGDTETLRSPFNTSDAAWNMGDWRRQTLRDWEWWFHWIYSSLLQDGNIFCTPEKFTNIKQKIEIWVYPAYWASCGYVAFAAKTVPIRTT